MKLDVLNAATDNPWYADGLKFTCSQCGNCCTGAPGYVWISDEEVSRLAAKLRLSEDEVLRTHCRTIGGGSGGGGRVSLKERRSPQGLYDCVFLREIKVGGGQGKPAQVKRVCGIYDVRPLQCRTWPFWDGNLASKENWDAAGERCHGINRGSRKFTREQIESLRDAEDWPDKPPTS